jgi:hypothetical protein
MRRITVAILAICLVAGCQPMRTTPTPSPAPTVTTETPTSQPEQKLPSDVNPLSGLRVTDPSLLKIPTLLVSISHFPATARPQAGLSFAPFVYEFYITEGATRFLAVFYGESPRPEAQVNGGCAMRSGPFVQSNLVVGNRAWLDSDGNGLQDPGEEGISGLCVNLYNANGNLIERTATNSNGYYGFNVQPGKYAIEFVKPQSLDFTKANAGDDSLDSDADPATGRAEVVVSADDLSVDAGMVYAGNTSPTSDPATLPLAQVGPVRSGRLIYSYIADYFENSCLIYAFASEEVLARLPQCHMVFHELTGGGYMMELSEMRSVAEENLKAKGSDFDYSGNLYSTDLLPNGAPAALLRVYFAYQNQSGWVYDPLSQSYQRYVDTSEYDQAGVLHPDTDRLTGRQIHIENLIVLYAQHEVLSPTNLDIHLDSGKTGKAVLFRNGRMFNIKWSTVQAAPEKHGNVRPVQFLQADGQPTALEPGHTWVIVVTPDTELSETASGEWLMNFAQPEGAK